MAVREVLRIENLLSRFYICFERGDLDEGSKDGAKWRIWARSSTDTSLSVYFSQYLTIQIARSENSSHNSISVSFSQDLTIPTCAEQYITRSENSSHNPAISHNISSGIGSISKDRFLRSTRWESQSINSSIESAFPNVKLSSWKPPLSILINVDWLMSCYRIEGWLQNLFPKKRIFRPKQNTACPLTLYCCLCKIHRPTHFASLSV